MRIALVQQSLVWQEPAANRAAFSAVFDRLRERVDLFILPEMFTTGFSMHSQQFAEPYPGETLAWMQRESARHDAAIAGSVMTLDRGRCTNRLIFVSPDGSAVFYDKRHLFRMGQEHQHYSPGQQCVVVRYRGVRIGLQVCYDLRFPVWSRRRPAFDYELLVYVANWPAARAFAWRQLLVARAIENQAYVAAVNRIGTDAGGVVHQGDSVLHDYLGGSVLAAGAGPGVFVGEVDLPALREFRERFPAHLDADPFTLSS